MANILLSTQQAEPVIVKTISKDTTVQSGTTRLHNETRIAAGVSVRIEAGGTLYIL